MRKYFVNCAFYAPEGRSSGPPERFRFFGAAGCGSIRHHYLALVLVKVMKKLLKNWFSVLLFVRFSFIMAMNNDWRW